MSKEFKLLGIEDKDLFDKYIKKSNITSNFSSFGTLFAWRKQFPIRFVEEYNSIIIKYGDKENCYMFPLGERNTQSLDFILKSENNDDFEIINITDDDKSFMEENYPDKFEFILDRDSSDYVFSWEKLGFLKGKKLSAKRNHINKFLANYPEYKYEKITSENIRDCEIMSLEWCKLNDCGRSAEVKKDACAVKEFFKFYDQLGMIGGLIRTDEKVVAFTFGEKMNDDMFVVHVEKAFNDISGAYPIINRDFVLNELSNYKWINREEDMGVEGLRKAKSSYQPDFMVNKYTAVLKKRI